MPINGVKISTSSLGLESLKGIFSNVDKFWINEISSSDESDDDEPAGECDDDVEKSDAEKLKILKRQSPELFPLLAELQTYKQEMDEVLTPLCAIFTDEGIV